MDTDDRRRVPNIGKDLTAKEVKELRVFMHWKITQLGHSGPGNQQVLKFIGGTFFSLNNRKGRIFLILRG
jgi:hypothetical protein